MCRMVDSILMLMNELIVGALLGVAVYSVLVDFLIVWGNHA